MAGCRNGPWPAGCGCWTTRCPTGCAISYRTRRVAGSNQVDCGTTGLISLAGEVIGNTVELFATNATLGDLDQTYLYGIDDLLSATALPSNESFAVLETAALDTNIRGVSFAPVPEPASVLCWGRASCTAVHPPAASFGFDRSIASNTLSGVKGKAVSIAPVASLYCIGDGCGDA